MLTFELAFDSTEAEDDDVSDLVAVFSTAFLALSLGLPIFEFFLPPFVLLLVKLAAFFFRLEVPFFDLFPFFG